ncbi:dephospho-CoA kinase [Colwellia sp. KU-HH00111]|uniref:dephospho-CoA kinase n=1 Tax=Colwellia sp. KU-HH00111 TaxID=3127652 RepID=UPI0031098077
MSNIIIGLTGGIGSGKTTVANLFAEHGVTIVDADIIAREVVNIGSPALHDIAEHFGASFIQADGQLNRSLLRQQIFSNEQDKLWLNNLLHPLIRSQLIAQTQAATSPYCLLVAPLLIENDLMHLIDRLLVIDVSEAAQLKRTTKRDGNTIKQVKDIMASQIERSDRVAQADDILNNDGSSMITLKKAVTKLHQSYLLMVDTA